MKVFVILLLLLPILLVNAQKIGELAPERPPEVFPTNGIGLDIMFGEGGFGFGTFYRKSFSQNFTGFIDFSISELKNDREVQYVDYYTGNTYTPDKINRALLIPFDLGIQYRIFSESITDSFRPFVSLAVGPDIILTTPYDTEFFTAFKFAKAHYAIGGYIGLGANIGISKTNLIGISIRYAYTNVFGDPIETLKGSFKNNFGQFYITLNLGTMY
jgi:hypothetical protein